MKAKFMYWFAYSAKISIKFYLTLNTVVKVMTLWSEGQGRYHGVTLTFVTMATRKSTNHSAPVAMATKIDQSGARKFYKRGADLTFGITSQGEPEEHTS